MTLLSAVILLSACTAAAGFDLTILHNNDVHAHIEQIDKYSGECSDEEAAAEICYGGEARRVSIIKQYRKEVPNLLVLDAGDRFTGTLWFIQYRGQAASHFVNMENYDAYCLGNHEFDLGVKGLVPYLDNLTVPVLDANIDVSREPRLQGKFNSSKIVTVGGEKIGIVGFITPDTGFIADAGPTITFHDPVAIVQAEVKKLQESGVKIIVGLSHTGYGPDQDIASQVDGLDIVVGGHSHTFLYSGNPPSVEKPEGPYPTVVTQASGRKVLVVQAYAWGKYMGVLNVTFDENFEVSSWTGNPVLLDKTIPQDTVALADILEMEKPLIETRKQVVGRTVVGLEGDPIQCRLRECNTGNLLTDAMVLYHVPKKTDNETWALASIAFMNSGGIRASTEPGVISNGQVLTILPFGNTIDLIDLKGVYLRQALEHAVARYSVTDRPGAFAQLSGVRVKYNLQHVPGQRVVSVEVRCLQCTVPTYAPLEDDVMYKILLPNFVISGGDGYTVIKENKQNHVELGSLDTDVLRDYLKHHAPVFAEAEGRIEFVEDVNCSTSGTPSTPTYGAPSIETSGTPSIETSGGPCNQTSGQSSVYNTSLGLVLALILVLGLEMKSACQ